MNQDLLRRYNRRVPRYTSYPTAPHFHSGIGPETYDGWLSALVPGAPLSLYVHIPFCDSLCWFCGCHTRVVRRYSPVAHYVDLLLRELSLVAARIPAPRIVSHLHLGGGSPTLLTPPDLARLSARIRRNFVVADAAEVAVEVDPRGLTDETIAALAAFGVNRASIGVQDVNAEVQRAINRIQPVAVTASAVERLRGAGIGSINVDLVYGLPYQSLDRLIETVEAVIDLAPDRIALFGYAHVPEFKAHQRLIPAEALPGPAERLAQAEAAAGRLADAGYSAIGLDHFARPGDALARAAASARLRRNFQGYTTDAGHALIGLGASAIGSLPEGYVQNAVSVRDYRTLIESGRLACAAVSSRT